MTANEPALTNFAPTSLDGLEQLLESTLASNNVIPGSTTVTSADPGMTLSEAAEYFEVTDRTLRRWIKQGRVTAWKVDGQWGPEWRVQEDQPEDVTPPPDSSTAMTTLASQDKLLELISEMHSKLSTANEQLQAAHFRNGYLEAQMESQREQIKLLSDHSKNHSWWHRFSSWFLGRQIVQ